MANINRTQGFNVDGSCTTWREVIVKNTLLALLASIQFVACAGGGDAETCDPTKLDCEDGGVCLFDRFEGDYACTEPCDPALVEACDERTVCEVITDQGGRTACVARVYLKGTVFDLTTGLAIPDALVMAQHTADGAGTDVVTSAADGAWSLEIRVVRDSHGDPATGDIYTLYASADDYLPYPSILRPALPVTLTQFDPETADDPASAWQFASALTGIGLLPVKEAEKGRASISGAVVPAAGGVLVVAECSAPPCPYAYTDHLGGFTIFNVAPGTYAVAGYRKGLYLEKPAVTVGAVDVTDTTLGASAFTGGVVTGSVNIVNAPGGARTSVVLLPESTFHATLVTGVVGPGLRAPEPPAAANVSGAFEITGVPEGRYVVLAAFENDGLVRDPDPGISGTQVVHLDVSAAGPATTLDSFKITEALAVVSPGADEPEAVTGTPVFIWADDSSEDAYDLKVYDIYGDLVWEKQLEGGVSGAENVEVPYEGPTLLPGMVYQWKAVSLRKGGPISTTEDLRGVFFVR